jgi:SAM-dependent methyltransferase
VQARAEVLPFADASFERVVCLLAMPYMNIPAAVREIHRILVDGGSLRVTVHPYYFTWRELIHNALPRPAATLYRLWVMLNGIIFHFTGRLLIFRGRCESFQTKRSITRALADAGFHVKFIGRAFQHFERIDITAVKVDSADVN